MKKCLVAMSGGVDSSAAARIMQEQGYDCIGCILTLCGNEQTADAAAVAEKLGLEFHVVSAEDAFRHHVMEDFARAYASGATPNPCVRCNRHLKFGVLLEKAMELGCDAVATGHYARVEQDPETGRYLLKKAADPAKDQSYMLYCLNQTQLKYAKFPLGDRTKSQARETAKNAGLSNANKAESQDICFVPDGDYAGFLREFTGTTPAVGAFVDENGAVLGQHKGIVHYTVGQRRGLGISAAHPLYVTKICPEDNTVVLGENQSLFSRELEAGDINLISVDKIVGELRCKAKIRYRHTEQPCTVTQPSPDTLRVVFDEPQRAITPGQSVVLYQDDVVVGGGIIR